MPQALLVHMHITLQLRQHTLICIQMQVCSLLLMPLNACPLTDGPIPSNLARHLSSLSNGGFGGTLCLCRLRFYCLPIKYPYDLRRIAQVRLSTSTSKSITCCSCLRGRSRCTRCRSWDCSAGSRRTCRCLSCKRLAMQHCTPHYSSLQHHDQALTSRDGILR